MDCLTLKKSNCKNCYKCIRHCPVKAIRFSGNQAHIIGDECILCGHCFVVCPQNAKEIVNETEKVKVLLQAYPVYVSLAPSFIANYEGVGINAMRRALKKLGFADVEETALGATVVKNEYDRLLREEKRDIVISSCCHSVNLLIQKYFPKELPYLADVLSPMQAHCQDLKKRHPGAKTVFIGPCVAKKDEASHYDGIVDAVLTYEELTEWLGSEGITLEKEILNVTNYIDLLNIRFGSSLIVKTDIKKSDLQRLVVPCTIQLLVENAVKHNALMENRPLHIDIHSDTIDITVSNNLIPRFSKSKSTGLGLHYIKEQYKMHSDRDIRILSTKESFTVKIPIL